MEPEWQSEGWGALLMRHGLAEAERLGHAAVVLVGDAPYYRRFGFQQALTEGLVLPGPVERERFLGLELGRARSRAPVATSSPPVRSRTRRGRLDPVHAVPVTDDGADYHPDPCHRALAPDTCNRRRPAMTNWPIHARIDGPS